MKISEVKFGQSSDDRSDAITYKRYTLSDEKSFDSLFFPEKESLLDLVDHFRAKTGKYAIKGYPHKLGLLLYGPPGTGKTSLIKALAQYTGRSIINVPLSRVNTNSELISVFFDQRYKVAGLYAPVKLGFRNVIYVMEDCDAASNVVKRRDGLMACGTDVFAPERVVLPTPKSWWRLFLESQSTKCQELVEELISASERLSEAADEMRPQILLGVASRLNDHPGLGLVDEAVSDPQVADVFDDAVNTARERRDQQSKLDGILVSHAVAIKNLLDAGVEVNEEFVEKLLGKQTAIIRSPVSSKIGLAQQAATMAESFAAFTNNAAPAQGPTTGTGTPTWFKENPDALSLAGLLNVLDGVVDTPGRIVIMTSNCPNRLDPALIRPGRVDKQLMLGYMGPEDVSSMLEHYFQVALTDKQLRRVVMAVGTSSTRKFTPAKVEQMASEYDDVEDMLLALEKADRSIESKIGILETDRAQDRENRG